MKQTDKQPLVTVLMTAYNAAPFIEKALTSIINQTYQKIEIVVVNDGSTDETSLILNRFKRQDNRVRVFRMKQNLGPSLASNFGVKKACGQVIARMDADDIAFPKRIEKQVRFLLKHPDVVIVGGQCLLIDASGIVIGEKQYPVKHQTIVNSLFTINPIQHPSCAINRQLLPKDFVFYHNHSLLAHDLELLFRISQYGKLANLKEKILYYRQYPWSLSLRNPKATFQATQEVRRVAERKYGYQPTFKARIVNWLQYLVISLLPAPMIYPVFCLWRGLAPLKISLLIVPRLNLGFSPSTLWTSWRHLAKNVTSLLF